MGIPCFYSYIVKNHGNIIKSLYHTQAHNLYIDGNSIIYDCYNATGEKNLILQVISQLDALIARVNPLNRCYVTFDGVAPLAKLKQQRVRRFKSEWEAEILDGLTTVQPNTVQPEPKWNTTAITPGTVFMENLSIHLQEHYLNSTKIVVSTSEQHGEGEHKIFALIRNDTEYHAETTTCIYGLDADLIMLSLNHSQYCKQIVLYRDTPHFIKNIDSSLDPNKEYILDIQMLAHTISTELGGMARTYDYVFICFILGNDFIPHTPSINIRTNGIDVLLSVYNNTIVKKNRFLIQSGSINWYNFKLFIEGLKHDEQSRIKEDFSKRRNFRMNKTTPADKLLFMPLLDKREENMINPYESYWQDRYYNILNDIDRGDDVVLKALCINYLEGLEWTVKYYTSGCCDWYWKYNYLYAPLFSDLYRFIPSFNIDLVSNNKMHPVSPYTQLSYVLPRSSHSLLPVEIQTHLHAKYHEYYNSGVIKWAFFKYFWESVIQFQDIDIVQLDKEIIQIYKEINIKNARVYI